MFLWEGIQNLVYHSSYLLMTPKCGLKSVKMAVGTGCSRDAEEGGAEGLARGRSFCLNCIPKGVRWINKGG